MNLYTCVYTCFFFYEEIFFVLRIFTLRIFCAQVNAQGGIGFGIKREIFFLNLEDGYFGCQVNESTAVLQIYELSRLCDGKQDCYKGSDELRRELKCTSKI